MLVLEIAFGFSMLHLEKRRLRDVDMTTLDQLGHLPVEKSKQKGANVRAVHVGIRHDDDAVVAQLLGRVILLADAGAEHTDERNDLLGREQFVQSRPLDVENLALERENRLELAVAALLGRTAGGIALHDIELALGGVALLAVGELAREPEGIQ